MSPLVLLHGFCEDSSVWKALLPHLHDVPVQCLDLLGFGQAALPASPHISAYAEAIHAHLQAQRIERCVLVGHSLGGYVALQFASRWPGMLAGMGLFHSHPYADTEERRENRKRAIALLHNGKKDAYVAELFPGLFTGQYTQDHTEVLQWLVAQAKEQPTEGIIAALQAMMTRPDHQDTMRQLECPVQMLLGTEDALIALNDGLRAATLPAVSDVQVLGEVAHMAMFEAPAAAAAALRSFWQMCQHHKA